MKDEVMLPTRRGAYIVFTMPTKTNGPKIDSNYVSPMNIT